MDSKTKTQKTDIVYGTSTSPVFITENSSVIVPLEPHVYAVFSKEQAENLGYEINRMKHYERISLNSSDPKGYELIEPDPERDPTKWWYE